MQRDQKSKPAVSAGMNGSLGNLGGGGAQNNICRPKEGPDRQEEAEVSLSLRQAAHGFSWLWMIATVCIIAFIGYTFVAHGSAMEVRKLTIDRQQVELSELYDAGCYDMCTKIKPLNAEGKTIIHYMDDNAHAYEKTILIFQIVVGYLVLTLAYVLVKAAEVIKRCKANARQHKKTAQ